LAFLFLFEHFDDPVELVEKGNRPVRVITWSNEPERKGKGRAHLNFTHWREDVDKERILSFLFEFVGAQNGDGIVFTKLVYRFICLTECM
jgi:hypothetical protein